MIDDQMIVPVGALTALVGVFHDGAAKHAKDVYWKRISITEHRAKAMGHLARVDSDDRTEDHLLHAVARLLMAWEIRYDDDHRSTSGGLGDDDDSGGVSAASPRLPT